MACLCFLFNTQPVLMMASLFFLLNTWPVLMLISFVLVIFQRAARDWNYLCIPFKKLNMSICLQTILNANALMTVL
jgi:hypothetical protein